MNTHYLHQKTWMTKQQKLGLCIFCRQPKLPHSQLCEKHFFARVATSTLKNRTLASGLARLWKLQKGKCYLTGRVLELGVNASLDHIIPQCNGGPISSLKNVRWCDINANFLKRGQSLSELLQLCKEILAKNT